MKTTLRKLTVAWPLAICLLLPALTRAETPVQAWVQRYSGPGNSTDIPNALAVDSSNNVIVTGVSTNYSSGTHGDYVTIKYSSAGVPLWTNLYNGLGNSGDEAWAVAVDGSNNVIVTGASGGDYVTIQYSGAGVPLWTNRYPGPGYTYPVDCTVAVDGSNNVIVVGNTATIQYSSAGVPLWTNLYNGGGASAVAVDGSNNVIVTGSSGGDYATVKYSGAGVPLWTNLYNGPGNGSDYATRVAVDGSNNVIVTGRSYGGSGSQDDYATIQYSSAGVPLWTNRYSGLGILDDWAWAVAVDGSNNVIVTGYSCGAGSVYDYATIKYSSAGVPLWTNLYNGSNERFSAYAYCVAVDGSNNVIVTGSAGMIKYSSAGITLWTNGYNSSVLSGMALDHSGNAILTGWSNGGASGYDFVTVKYICVPLPALTGLQRTNGTFYTRVDGVLQPGTLVIEASTNLMDWAPVFTNTTPTNVLFYTDPDAGNYPGRFYRVFQFP